MRPSTLVSKMAFLVIIIIGDLIQVLIMLSKQLVTIILSRKIDYVYPSGWGRVLKHWAVITRIFSIAFIFLVGFLRFLKRLGILEAVRRQDFTLIKPERIPVKNLLFGVFLYLWKRWIAPRTINIYFTDPKQKVECRFGFWNNSFLDGIPSDIFLTIIMIGL